MMSRVELLQEAQGLQWFHSIDFGDWISPERTPHKALVANSTLLPVWNFLERLDLRKRACLDIGAADGIVAFTMEQMGARRVVATDGNPRRTFEVARDLLDSGVQYQPDMPDTQLATRLRPKSYDLIVMAGFLYHLFCPMAALAACRRALKPGGLLLLESVYTGGEEAAAYLNTAMDPPLTEQWSTYWIPTAACLEGQLNLACFDILGSASLGRKLTTKIPGRIAYLCRASAPDDIAHRTPQLIQTHARLKAVPELDFRSMGEAARRPIAYNHSREHVELSPKRHPGWVPLLPKLSASPGARVV